MSGDLPREVFAPGAGTNAAFARCDIDVTAPGRIGLRLNSPAGLKLWVDGQAVEVKQDTDINLQRGVHAFTFQIDPAARGAEPLRVELREVPGSAGAAQPVGGA